MKTAYVQTLIELADRDERVFVVEADLSVASGTLAFREKFPKRYVDVGVAEANMVGIAAGLAAEGMIPFCCSFTPFASRRVYDQITVSVAYANLNVKIVGMAPGFTTLLNGGTHMCFQDMAIMRAMPNMVVLSPADSQELAACMHWMAETESPAYLQLIRQEQKPLFPPSYRFDPGKAVRLHDGADVTVLSTGYMTKFALQAAEILSGEGVQVDLLHCPCVKPFPFSDVLESVQRTKCAVTVENQSIIGGLGGATAEALSEHYPVPIKRMGIPDQFGEVVAEESYILEKYRFGTTHIAATCRELASGK